MIDRGHFVSATLLLYTLVSSQSSFGLGSAGPNISAEGSSSSPVASEVLDPKFDLSLKKTKQAVELVAPAGELLAGSWYLKYQQNHEHRTYTGASAATDFSAKFTELRSNYLGFIYVNKVLVPNVNVVLIAGRYGLSTLQRDVRPMGEYFGILSFKVADFGLSLFPDKSDATTLVFRVRNWNYGTKNTPIFIQKISLGDGFTLDIGIVSHVKLSWNSQDDRWGIYLNGEGSSQQNAVRENGQTIWINGHVIDGYMGVRRHLANIFYLAIEGGMHRDHSTYNDQTGAILREQESEFAPWARIRLETFVP